MRAPDANAEPIDPRHQAMLKIGDNAYPVDLTNDPQARSGSSMNGRPGTGGGGGGGGGGASGNGVGHRVGHQDDPLAQQMEQLRNGASSVNSMRKNTLPGGSSSSNGPSMTGDNLSPPPGSRGGGAPNRDYRRSAEFVVGGLPPGVVLPPSSRPTSPSPSAPTANFMKPPSQIQTQGMDMGIGDVQNVVADYQQSFPGERKSVSRPGSRASVYGQSQQSQIGSAMGRPVSSEGNGFVGQRSTSPQPYPVQGMQPPQPQPSPVNRRNSYRVGPGGGGPPLVSTPSTTSNVSNAGPGSTISPSSVSSISSVTGRSNSISVPQIPAHQQRPTSPSNSVGIALSADGGVALDVMRDRYQQQQVQQVQSQGQGQGQLGYRGPIPGQQQQPTQQQVSQMGGQGQGQGQGRSTSYNIPPQTQPPYGAPPPAPSGFPPSYPQQSGPSPVNYAAQPPPQQQPPQQQQQQQQQQQAQGRPPYSQQPPQQQWNQQPSQGGYDYTQPPQGGPAPPPQGGMVQRNPSMNQGL
ncbi:hypothetical protein NLI96_g13166 [Meripilus lineatus]|uniref:Uncharacterized protein n=1 Tax=Meripilus lineatus TaxID=2056292 RepID=A0AAD5UNI3_9APHY|nr:hypothetical protein NLI96_g13166 [Physisporinus lineatus]